MSGSWPALAHHPGQAARLERLGRNSLRKPLGRESGEVEAISVHHLGPRRHEVGHELRFRVVGSVDFGKGAQLRVRTEDEVDTGAGPLQFAALAVVSLE